MLRIMAPSFPPNSETWVTTPLIFIGVDISSASSWHDQMVSASRINTIEWKGFMVGILVSVVKLAKMAKIIPGISLYSFLALIFVLTAMTVSLDSHLIWHKWEEHR